MMTDDSFSRCLFLFRSKGCQCLVLILALFGALSCTAQQLAPDSVYIGKFDLPNVIESNPGVYHTSYNFVHARHQHDYRLLANSNGYLSNYGSYKWFSFNYSVAIPGTRLDNHDKFHYTSLRYRLIGSSMIVEPFMDAYNGLLAPTAFRKRFEPVRNMQTRDAGVDYYYFTNSDRFSFRAAYSLAACQKKSAGAFFFMATPKWQQLHWSWPARPMIKDSLTYGLLSSDPQWVSLVGRVGYAYNAVLDQGRWIIAPSLSAGGGGLQQINLHRWRLAEVTDLRAALNAGYNGSSFYLYANGFWEKIHTDLRIRQMVQLNTDCSLTAGLRFGNSKNRILNLL